MNDSKNTTIAKSLRASEASFESIKQLAEARGISQGELIEDLIRSYEISNAKIELPGAAEVVDDFKHHLTRVHESFLYVLELSRSADERAKSAATEELSSRDKIIVSLQQEKTRAELEASEAIQKLEELQTANNSLNSQIVEFKSAMEASRASLNDKQTIIETLTARLPSQEKTEQKVSDMQSTIENLNSCITDLTNKEHNALLELDNLKKEREYDKKQHQNAITAAVLEVKIEGQRKMEEYIYNYQNRIDEYVSKLEEKDKLIENLRNELHRISYKAM